MTLVKSSYRVKRCVQTSYCDQLPTPKRMETPRTSWKEQLASDFKSLWLLYPFKTTKNRKCSESVARSSHHIYEGTATWPLLPCGVQCQCAIASCKAVCNDGVPSGNQTWLAGKSLICNHFHDIWRLPETGGYP